MIDNYGVYAPDLIKIAFITIGKQWFNNARAFASKLFSFSVQFQSGNALSWLIGWLFLGRVRVPIYDPDGHIAANPHARVREPSKP